MKREPEREILSKFEALMRGHSFNLERLNIEESIAEFQTVAGSHKYFFWLSFIRHGNNVIIDPGVILVNEQISRVIGMITSNSNDEYYAISTSKVL